MSLVQKSLSHGNGRTTRNSPSSKSVPGMVTNFPPVRGRSPPRSEKVPRVRATSVSSPSPPQPTRKRSSSGVFQVDDSEPLPKKPEPLPKKSEPTPKKTEHVRALSDGALKKTKLVANGRRKGTETPEDTKEQKKIIDRFDSKAKTTCVSAFKESDSWD